MAALTPRNGGVDAEEATEEGGNKRERERRGSSCARRIFKTIPDPPRLPVSLESLPHGPPPQMQGDKGHRGAVPRSHGPGSQPRPLPP